MTRKLDQASQPLHTPEERNISNDTRVPNPGILARIRALIRGDAATPVPAKESAPALPAGVQHLNRTVLDAGMIPFDSAVQKQLQRKSGIGFNGMMGGEDRLGPRVSLHVVHLPRQDGDRGPVENPNRMLVSLTETELFNSYFRAIRRGLERAEAFNARYQPLQQEYVKLLEQGAAPERIRAARAATDAAFPLEIATRCDRCLKALETLLGRMQLETPRQGHVQRFPDPGQVFRDLFREFPIESL